MLFSFGEIYRNNTLLRYTGEFGNFDLEFPYGTERVTLRIVDANGGQFQTKIHTITFATGQYGVTVDTIPLVELPTPVVIDSTQENTIDVTTSDGTDIGAVILPANSIYAADGNLFEVNVY